MKKCQKNSNSNQTNDLMIYRAYTGRCFYSFTFYFLLFLITTSIASNSKTTHESLEISSCKAEKDNNLSQDKGFNPIFNGNSLSGWEGDPALWSVKDGCIVGETTEDLQIKGSSFLTWTNAIVDDFELKLCFKIDGKNANSGIQYRSKYLPKEGNWKLGGYQADFDVNNEYTGIFYEASGRGVLTERGDNVILLSEKKKNNKNLNEISNFVASEDGGLIKANKWYEYRIIAIGYNFIHIIDNHTTVNITDNDLKKRARKGLLGFQLHDGPPMKVQFKNIWLKKL